MKQLKPNTEVTTKYGIGLIHSRREDGVYLVSINGEIRYFRENEVWPISFSPDHDRLKWWLRGFFQALWVCAIMAIWPVVVLFSPFFIMGILGFYGYRLYSYAFGIVENGDEEFSGETISAYFTGIVGGFGCLIPMMVVLGDGGMDLFWSWMWDNYTLPFLF